MLSMLKDSDLTLKKLIKSKTTRHAETNMDCKNWLDQTVFLFIKVITLRHLTFLATLEKFKYIGPKSSTGKTENC